MTGPTVLPGVLGNAVRPASLRPCQGGINQEMSVFHVPYFKQPDPAKQAGQIINALPPAPRASDFIFTDYGRLCVLTPRSVEAAVWVNSHLPADAQRWAGGVVIEPRYADDILAGIESDGLEVA